MSLPRFLVIGDKRPVASHLRAVFGEAQSLRCLSSSEEALRYLADRDVDVVLVDRTLLAQPGEEGALPQTTAREANESNTVKALGELLKTLAGSARHPARRAPGTHTRQPERGDDCDAPGFEV